MNGGNDDSKETQDFDLPSDGEMEATVVLKEEPVDNVGDISAEINVEKLVAKIESGDTEEFEEKREVKRRLEEIQEEIGDNLDSTYNINLDDD